MEENQNTENEKKKVKKKNNEKKLSNFFNAHKGEFKKITWPSKDELLKQSVTVIVVSLIVGAVIFVYDTAISYTYEKSISIIKNEASSNAVTEESETTDVSDEVSENGETTEVLEDDETADEAAEISDTDEAADVSGESSSEEAAE